MTANASRPRIETIAATLREHDLKRSASWLLYAIVLTVVAFFVWAAMFHVDTVTRAQGRVIPSGRIQVIQSLEGGVVQAIHVKQGQKVADGVALVSLSSIQADGDYQSRRQQRFALLARVARLRAELTETVPSFGAELERDAREFVSIERAAWRARAEERDAQIRYSIPSASSAAGKSRKPGSSFRPPNVPWHSLGRSDAFLRSWWPEGLSRRSNWSG